MNLKIGVVLLSTYIFSCVGVKDDTMTKQLPISVVGTWKLLSGTIIEKGDTTVTDYTKNVSFIKVINATHFAFFNHDLNRGKDSTAIFTAGGGRYSLMDSVYSEHLEYCSARNWEGNDFKFTVQVKEDTLIQSGVEKIESEGVNRINIEKYIRVIK